MKKIVWIDMDGVLVDLGSNFEKWFDENPNLVKKYKGSPDHIPGIFRDPEPIDGAIDAVRRLNNSGLYDLHIATSAPWGNPYSSTDKRYWIEKYFGKLFHKKLTITHRKDLLIGDYLIDDRLANGAKDFKGELMRFGWDYENQVKNDYPNWDSILEVLLPTEDNVGGKTITTPSGDWVVYIND
jgi:5'-nucleotidase